MTMKTEQNSEVYEELLSSGKSLLQLYTETKKELERSKEEIVELQRDACYLCARQEGVHY